MGNQFFAGTGNNRNLHLTVISFKEKREKISSIKPATNMKEALRGEGGSDVFSSNRHVNPNANQAEHSAGERNFWRNEKQSTQASNEFKMKFWSNDDSPLIRPLLRTEPHSIKRPEITMGVNQHHADGYGGIACERITKISGRTSRQWMAAYAALILGGSAIFGLLVKYRKPKIA